MISAVTATVDLSVPYSHGSTLLRSLPDYGAALTCHHICIGSRDGAARWLELHRSKMPFDL